MGQKIARISKDFKNAMRDPSRRGVWQSGLGITIFALFVLSSVVVNRAVQALNQSAGSYGYYGGSYGYQTTTSSDQVPSVVTGASAASGSAQVTVSWNAVTTTESSTSLDNFSSYVVYYSTSSSAVLDTSNAGTNSGSASRWTSSNDSGLTTQGSSGATRSSIVTGLTNGTAYYFAVYAVDNNGNYSDAPSAITSTPAASGSTSSSGGGGGGGSTTGTTYPTSTTGTTTGTTAPVTPVVSNVLSDADALAAQMGLARDTATEATYSTRVSQSAQELGVTLSSTQSTQAVNFVTYGSSAATQRLGSGERLALVRDALDTLDRFPNNPTTFFEQLATGQKPAERNISAEVGQLRTVLPAWERLVGHRPNFRNASEDLAWNTAMYRVRFTPRDLAKERLGITKFRGVFGRTPTSPLDWSLVRAWGYVLAPR